MKVKEYEKRRWKAVAAFLMKQVAVREANTSCSLWSYQPKEPEAVKKLRKF